MHQSQQIIPKLRQLFELDKVQKQLKKYNNPTNSVDTEIQTLRSILPTSILLHYDARQSRGKMGVAPVSHGICGSCHLTVPKGRLAALRRIEDSLNVCEHCGAFIYLADEAEPAANEQPAEQSESKAKKAIKSKPAIRATKPSIRKALAAH